MKRRELTIVVSVVIFFIVVIAISLLFRAYSSDVWLQGEVDAPEVIVSSKAKGRVIDRFVQRGDDVVKGQNLISLESPELVSQLKKYEALRDQAKSNLAMSQNGTREEELRFAKAQLLEATQNFKKSEMTYQRIAKLFPQHYVSKDELDESFRNQESDRQKLKSAKSLLDEAQNGDRIEQRQAYEATLRATEHELNETAVIVKDLLVTSPINGEVGTMPAEEGDLLNALSPLLVLIDLEQSYFVFDIREDILSGIHKGDNVSLRIPALNEKIVTAQVRYISPLGDFSTKRATRATGDFDLKTFEIRLYPSESIEGLRPGMSVLWLWKL
ncbi:HlyD family secretion protein [Hafnia alvei]|uniref:HlyD family efflux transporter periplasmic adaptor subunit n=1 Tax=Hafnia alvei TaxID=569 RepID=A0ABD7Q1Z7_HAFAL|nr:efflux RND transporter periplasmic adaptor subunit [Hafnia alvei]TBL66448.1 HlyD family efflux transporter periplasmic adaptor subunit [Hafnia alvei]